MALLQCLRAKSSEELLSISQVKREGNLGTRLSFEWNRRQILPLSYLFRFRTWTDGGWGFLVMTVKKAMWNIELLEFNLRRLTS